MQSLLSWKQAVHIVWAIGWADFLLKYRGSILGYVWSFLVPLVKFLVFLYVFQVLFVVKIPYYPLYLFLGIIVWEFFLQITNGCMSMPLEKAGIIQKVSFPRLLLILGVGWTSTIIFCTHIAMFTIFALFFGVFPSWNYLYLPIFIVQMSMLFLGVGMILSSYALRYRDLPHLWGVALQVLFWLTPITYGHRVTTPTSVEMMNVLSSLESFYGWGTLQIFTRFQPLSLILFDVRRVMLPENGLVFPSLVHAVTLTLLCFAVCILGSRIFKRRSRYFIQEY